jgi:PAS domain S-box-containing protein
MKKTLRVLNVEDSPQDAILINRRLSQAGYEIISERVDTAAAMKGALGWQQWDVVLCDYSMPKFSAIDALSLLKKTGLDIPFIIISGTIGEEIAVQSMLMGAHDYLMKDKLARLVPAVEREIEEARKRLSLKQAEEALVASESDLRAVFAAITDEIFVLDSEGCYLNIASSDPENPLRSPHGLIGKTLHDIFPKEQADSFLDLIHKALNEDRPQRVEYSMTVDGDELWFDGSLSPMSGESVIWIARDITERKRAEDQIRASLDEKVLLLREMNHRVRNNLAVISSMLKLQSGNTKNKSIDEILLACRNRVISMSMIHDQLYKTSLMAEIDFDIYVRDLVDELQMSYGSDRSNVKLTVDAPSIKMNVDTAIPCGLIVNELVSNCFKHAFPDGRKGEIHVSLYLAGEEEYILTIRDNGVGLPKGLDSNSSSSLGLILVPGLVNQLNGHLEINTESGTEFKIRFKELQYRKRF